MMKSLISTALLFGLFISDLPVASAEIMLVVHPNTALTRITIDDVKKLYLGKLTDVNGVTVQPVDQSKDSPARAEFYQKFVKMPRGKLKGYWTRMIFSGNATPPKVVGNDRDVIQWVANHTNALGYVDANSVNNDNTVKAFSLR